MPEELQPTPPTIPQRPVPAVRSHASKPNLVQAVQLRDITFGAIKDLNATEATTLQDKVSRAQGIARLLQGWESVQDRLRIIKNKPLPGSRRPAPDKPKRKQAILASVSDLHKLEPVSEPDATTPES